MSQAKKDATAMTETLVKWKSTPDEVKSMNDAGWNKLAFQSGIPAGATKAMKARVIMELQHRLAGPEPTIEELMNRVRGTQEATQ